MLKIIKKLIPLLIFVIGGVFGIFSKDYIQIKSSFFNWFILGALPIGIYYTFSLTSKYASNEGGGVALGRIAITIFVTMISFRAIQGYIILYNCNIGRQTEVYLKGEIIDINFPKPKKLFDKNSIEVSLKEPYNTIKLEVPTDRYLVGQTFEKVMTEGSLGIIYSTK